MPKPPGGGLVRRLLSILVALTCLVGCHGALRPEDPAAQSSAPSQARTSRSEPSQQTVPRTDVCDRLSGKAVQQALSAPVATTDHYTNGDEVEVAPGRKDVAHEYGCTYRTADGATARLWVFVPPVSASDADRLVRRARRDDRDCSFPDRVSFGDPSLTSVCVRHLTSGRGGDEEVLRVRLQGLFDQSWVGCEVAVPQQGEGDDSSAEEGSGRTGLVRRTGQWCTGAVEAISEAERQ